MRFLPSQIVCILFKSTCLPIFGNAIFFFTEGAFYSFCWPNQWLPPQNLYFCLNEAISLEVCDPISITVFDLWLLFFTNICCCTSLFIDWPSNDIWKGVRPLTYVYTSLAHQQRLIQNIILIPSMFLSHIRKSWDNSKICWSGLGSSPLRFTGVDLPSCWSCLLKRCLSISFVACIVSDFCFCSLREIKSRQWLYTIHWHHWLSMWCWPELLQTLLC